MLISARVTGAGSSRYQGVSADRSVELALLPTEVWVECRAVALGANAEQFLAGVWHVMTTSSTKRSLGGSVALWALLWPLWRSLGKIPHTVAVQRCVPQRRQLVYFSPMVLTTSGPRV